MVETHDKLRLLEVLITVTGLILAIRLDINQDLLILFLLLLVEYCFLILWKSHVIWNKFFSLKNLIIFPISALLALTLAQVLSIAFKAHSEPNLLAYILFHLGGLIVFLVLI